MHIARPPARAHLCQWPGLVAAIPVGAGWRCQPRAVPCCPNNTITRRRLHLHSVAVTGHAGYCATSQAFHMPWQPAHLVPAAPILVARPLPPTAPYPCLHRTIEDYTLGPFHHHRPYIPSTSRHVAPGTTPRQHAPRAQRQPRCPHIPTSGVSCRRSTFPTRCRSSPTVRSSAPARPSSAPTRPPCSSRHTARPSSREPSCSSWSCG